MLRPFSISRFAGLKLNVEADQVGPGEALDLLNVDLGKQSVRARDGYTHFLASPGSHKWTTVSPFYRRDNPNPQLVALDSTGVIVVFKADGTVYPASTANPAGGYEQGPYNFARFGTPSAEYLFGGIRKTGDQMIYRWDGAVYALTAVPYGAKFVAVQASDNRLVMANLDVPDSSSVRFSDPGAPLTFGANNYVTLSPGDGEELTGLGAWRELIFTGKANKFFVFYGNTTDGQGNPIFNYKTVDAGVGPVGEYASCAGPDGWYFVARDGVYLTQGSTPRRISDDVTPIFEGSTLPFFSASSALNAAQIAKVAVHWAVGRLFVAYPSGSSTVNDRLLVHDPRTGEWLLSAIPINAMTTFRPGGSDELFFSYSTGSNQIGRFSFVPGTYTTDDGAAISWHYRSGFYAPGNAPTQEVALRESILDGIGTPTFSVSKNFDASLPSTGGGAKRAVPLGISPAYAQGRHRVAQKGQRFSYQIEGTGPGLVTSITQHIRGVRPPGEGD